MRLTEVKGRIEGIAAELVANDRRHMLDIAEELRDLAAEIPRRPPVMKAKATSRKMTPEIEEEIGELHRQNPTWSQARIARHVGVNAGRVSETLAGFRS